MVYNSKNTGQFDVGQDGGGFIGDWGKEAEKEVRCRHCTSEVLAEDLPTRQAESRLALSASTIPAA